MREDVPLDGLDEDKARLIEKFQLVPKKINNKFYWVRQFGNRPDHPYATHRAVVRCSPLELVFSFYDLCVAKMTYFTRNISDYDICKFNYRTQKLESCPVWDMEFLVQKGTRIPVDLRNLAAITDITVFREMCSWLETQLQEKLHQEPEQVLIPVLFGQEYSYYFETSA
jgi:hypothetical protein